MIIVSHDDDNNDMGRSSHSGFYHILETKEIIELYSYPLFYISSTTYYYIHIWVTIPIYHIYIYL